MWVNMDDDDRMVAMTALRFWRGAAHKKMTGLPDSDTPNGDGAQPRLTRTLVAGRVSRAGELLNRLESGVDE